MTQQLLLVGRGIYSFPRASQLTGIPTQNLRRWAMGRPSSANSASASPLVHMDLPQIGEEAALSFLNLVELKLLGEFRRLDLPLQYLRRVVEVLRDSYDFEHPLACKRLATDGQAIFAEVDESGEFACIEIAGRRPNHVVMEDVVRPFFQDIEFYHDSDLARRWFPLGPSGGIVLDPAQAFGEPILTEHGLPTDMLASLVAAGDSPTMVADWYEVPVEAVEKAVAFETSVARRVAA